MGPAATILIPTYDHGPTLAWSVQSALAQTVDDIEVFVVGDGVPDVSRDILADFVRRDERVRFFDNPKGPRHGEVHRHAALAEARGRAVCYLSDDDRFLPDHVERVLADLDEGADFTHALPLDILPDGRLARWIVDLSLPFYVERELAGENAIPLSCAAHTLEAYRRLPHGWRTTPAGVWTDLYMWQQFLRVPGLRFHSGAHPTVLHFGSVERRGWTIDERVAELSAWAARVEQPGFGEEWRQSVLDLVAPNAAHLTEQLERSGQHVRNLEQHIAALDGRVESSERELSRLRGEASERDVQLAELHALVAAHVSTIERLRGDIEQHVVVGNHLRHERDGALTQLAAIRATRTWRWHERMTSRPWLRRVMRTAARAPFGRAGR